MIGWDDPQDASITGYEILRRDRAIHELGLFETIEDDTGSAATSYSDTTVAAGGSYVYRVKAINPIGRSASSTFARADVPDAPPDPVVTLDIDEEDDNQATVTSERQLPPPQASLTFDLGDITEPGSASTHSGGLGPEGYDDLTVTKVRYDFTLTETRQLSLSLDQPASEASMSLEGLLWGRAIQAGHNAEGTAQQIDTILRKGSYRLYLNPDAPVGQELEQLAYVLGYAVYDLSNVSESIVRDDLGNVFEFGSVEFSADSDTLGRVEVGNIISGSGNGSDDEDWVGVELEAGVSYSLILRGANRNVPEGEPNQKGWNWGSRLLNKYTDPGGNEHLLRSNDCLDTGVGLDCDHLYLSYLPTDGLIKAKTSGLYFFHIDAAAGDRYTFAVARAEDDCGQSVSSHCTVSVGSSVTGSISWIDPHEYLDDPEDFFHTPTYVDVDWWAVELEAGSIYQIDLEAAEVDGSVRGPLLDPHLYRVRNSHGSSAGGSDDWDSGEGFNARLLFRASETDTYFILAGDGRDDYGDYRLTIVEITPPEPDVADDETTTEVLTAGADPSPGFIHVSTDHDWYRVALEAGTSYRVRIEGIAPFKLVSIAGIRPQGQTGPVYRGARLGGEAWWWSPTEVVFTPTLSGDWFVDVGNSACCSADVRIGHYTVSVAEVETLDADSFAAIAADATALTLDETVLGEAVDPPNDADAWFSAELVADTTYEFEVTETLPHGYPQPFIRAVYGADGTIIPDSASDQFTPSESGTYYVRVGKHRLEFTEYDISPPSFRITLTAHETAESESEENTAPPVDEVGDLPADTTTTGEVQVGRSVFGELEKALDEDWFKVSLSGGTEYQIDMRGQWTGEWMLVDGSPAYVSIGSLYDPRLTGVYDAQGDLVDGSDGETNARGLESRITFTPGADGTYYIGASAEAGWTGTYQLSVIETS